MHGDENIREYVKTLNLTGTVIDLLNGHLDAQSSENDSVLLVVTGVVRAPGSAIAQPFIQTFLLTPQQANETKKVSYFVRNSIFRLIDAPVTSSAITAPVPAAAPVVAAKEPQATATRQPEPQHAAVQQQPVAEVEPVQAQPATGTATPPTAPAPVTAQKIEPAKVPAPANDGAPKTFASLFQNVSAQSSVPSQDSLRSRPSKAPVAASSANNGEVAAKKADAPRADSKPASHPSIYVNHLVEGTSEDELEALFAEFGKIKKIDLHDGRGYAFIEYAAADGVKNAMDAFRANETLFTVKGKVIGVEEKQGGKKEKTSSSNSSQQRGGGGGRNPRSSGGEKSSGKEAAKPGTEGKNTSAKR